jgi:hypothetical protein
MKKVLTLALLFVAPFLVTVQLRADTFIFNDLSDTGSITQIGSLSTLTIDNGNGTEAITYTISRPGSTIVSGGSINALSEPGDPTLLSDALQIHSGYTGTSSVLIDVLSNGETISSINFLCASGCPAETGLPQELGTITWVDNVTGLQTTDSLQVQSDPSESSSPVPEPSSLLLLSSGLLSVGGIVRRKLFS